MARTQPSKAGADPLRSRTLVNGWPAAPRVKIGLATAGDVDAVAEPIALTDVPREDTMMDALEQEIVGIALRAGLDRGIPALHHAVAGHVQDGGTLEGSYLRAVLCLVADHHDIAGTLLAYPPINVVAQIMNATEGMISQQQAFTLWLLRASLSVRRRRTTVSGSVAEVRVLGSASEHGVLC